MAENLGEACPRVGIIADDLTGCGDAGSFCFKAGLRTRIFVSTEGFSRRAAAGCDAVLVNTDSRFHSSRTARRRVRRAVAGLQRLGVRFFFKKIDSTLRGNIGPELDTFIDALKLSRLPLVAAYPSAGRTTVDGCQYVSGLPLTKTFFGRDPRNRIISAHIPTLLKATSRHVGKIHVHDAALQRDLSRIVRADPSAFYAGAAGILKFLLLSWIKPRQIKLPRSIPPRHILVICGSMHPASRRQTDYLIKKTSILTGLRVIRAPREKTDPGRVMRNLARQAAAEMRSRDYREVILIGGDTAQNICRIFKINRLDIEKVIGTGIVRARAETGCRVVLKPGGYGGPQCLFRYIRGMKYRS